MKAARMRAVWMRGMPVLAASLILSVGLAGCGPVQDAVRKVRSALSGSGEAPASKPAAKYYCPMHPTYTAPKPGLCPICNMNLVPMKVSDASPSGRSGDRTAASSAGAAQDGAMKPTGPQSVCLRHECPMLKAGEECPMLIVTEKGETAECPVCRKRIADAELEPVPGTDPEGYAAVTLSPEKRQLIGIRTDKVGVRSLRSVVRTAGLALPSPEINLFIYESDLPGLTEGTPIEAFFPALGRKLEGTISRIPLSLDRGLSPSTYGAGAVLSAGSNQFTVRARVSDPERLLRRGMTADVEIHKEIGRSVAVAEPAVFFTGRRAIVFVERPGAEGVYEPREVVLGARAEGFYAVDKGLEEGESVVVNGNFLLDSESRLTAAFRSASGEGVSEISGAGTSGTSDPGTSQQAGHVH